jgi:hypothetical protein
LRQSQAGVGGVGAQRMQRLDVCRGCAARSCRRWR